jgi:hypothetical protein
VEGQGEMSTEANTPYEFHLQFWGEVQNEKWVERDLGITDQDFWFSSKSARDEFRARLKAVADSHKVVIVFAENEGHDMRLRTVARMNLTMPDGRVFPLVYDFGYAYPPDSAEYVFTHGNNGCDCNLSLLLKQRGHEVPAMECGDLIKVSELKVTREP